MITSSAKKRQQKMVVNDEDCEIGSDDEVGLAPEVTGRAVSPSDQGLAQYSDYDSDSCSSRKHRQLSKLLLKGGKGVQLVPDSQGNTRRHTKRNPTLPHAKFVMNDTIKPQQTSFAMRNSMLEDECQNMRAQGTNKLHNPLLPKSSSECDVNLPVPETEVSEDTQVVFGRETDDFTQPLNSTVSVLDKSGPGTERGIM